jgi:hypothetical protein
MVSPEWRRFQSVSSWFGSGQLWIRAAVERSLAQHAIATIPSLKAKPTDLVFDGEPMTPENVSLAFLRLAVP